MKSRFSEEQIIGILKQQESGRSVVEICREQNIADNEEWATRTRHRLCPRNKGIVSSCVRCVS